MSHLTVPVLSAISGALIVGLPLLIKTFFRWRRERTIWLNSPESAGREAERVAERRRNWKSFMISLAASLAASALCFCAAQLFTSQRGRLIETNIAPTEYEPAIAVHEQVQSIPERVADTPAPDTLSDANLEQETSAVAHAPSTEELEGPASIPLDTLVPMRITPIVSVSDAVSYTLVLESPSARQFWDGTEKSILISGATTSTPLALPGNPHLDNGRCKSRVLVEGAMTTAAFTLAAADENAAGEVPEHRVLVEDATTTGFIGTLKPDTSVQVTSAVRILVEGAAASSLWKMKPPDLEIAHQ